ncbi:unnamed protein product, partial [Hapterophycus canaliculatus]
ATLPVSNAPSSPSYFREEHAWPRAGATTPPRQRPPPNFSWAAEPPPPDSPRRTGGAEGVGDAWKAAWSKRFARGPIHSEYQDRFPWPPPPPPPLQRRGRGRPPARAGGEAGVGGGGGGGVGGYGSSSAPPARSASPLPSRRRQNNDGSDRGDGEEGRSQAARGRSAPPRDRYRTTEVSRVRERRGGGRRPSSPVEGTREYGDGDGDGDGDGGGRMAAPGGPTGRGDRHEGDGDRAGAGRSTVVLASSAPSDGLVSEWEAVGSASRGSEGLGAVSDDERRRASAREDEDGGGRGDRYGGGSGSSVAGTSMLGSTRGATEEMAGGVEVWRGETAGRGGVRTMSGGRTLDYSSQSILTEYMDEYAWPSRMPVPGRRGQRTGMGVDHVGRLLSGKRAEEPRRPLDPDVVARLGAAADRALKAGSPRHLSEMCRLKSPSQACRKLVLGLVVALGLRWRRWSDIRTHLLGNRPELQGFLSRFDKHRAGLTSAALRPFAEDPSLSPTEVRRVAACMVWVSR